MESELGSDRAAELAAFFGGNVVATVRDVWAVPGDVVGRVAGLRRGQVALITGASGAGKSVTLAAVAGALELGRVIWVDRLRVAERAVMTLFGDAPLGDVLGVLARVGLAEAGVLLRRPGELSEGQRWRLRVALGLWEAASSGGGEGVTLVCDEFCGPLDEVTARVVARSFARAVRATGVRAVVATWRESLGEEMEADLVVRCDFGRWDMVRGPADGSERVALRGVLGEEVRRNAAHMGGKALHAAAS